MHPAAVGFQCPECVREGNRTVRTPRTALGGALRGNEALVTRILIGINVAVFLLGLLGGLGSVLGGGTGASWVQVHLGEYGYAIAVNHQYYRLITAAFVHFGLLHIALNMYALWLIGRVLEGALGRSRFLGLYAVSALGGSALAYAAAPPNVLEAGASGAIFGLFAALLVVGRRVGADIRGIAVIIVLNLVITFVLPAISGVGISWQAHIGGLVTGAVVASALAYAPRGRLRTPVQLSGFVLMTVVACALVVLRTAQLVS